jgi:hypothetical protein
MDARRFNQIDNDALEFPAIRISSKHEQCLTHCWTIGVTSFVLLVKGGEDQTKLEIRSWTEPTVSPLNADGITLSFSQLKKFYSLVKGAHDAVISSLFVFGKYLAVICCCAMMKCAELSERGSIYREANLHSSDVTASAGSESSWSIFRNMWRGEYIANGRG